MGNRAALLIGVSEFGTGFDALPGSFLDLQGMEQVLKDPDCGAYEIKSLHNKDNISLNSEIESFFRNRDLDDLLLFYFSGHGDLGSGGFSNQQLHLCANNSEKENGVLVESTAVSAAFLKRQMDICRAKNIIVILDCCYSGSIADLLKKGKEEIDFQELRAEGRVILASSSASQAALQEKEGLSLYTKYLIEGMQTVVPVEGKWIAARQLHDFADRRFEVERQGGYRPKIISDETGFNLPIVKAPKPDPKLEYRQEVDRIFQELDHELHFEFNGEIEDPFDRGSLDTCRERWKLTVEDAESIEEIVQEPYLIRAKKRQKYVEFVQLAISNGKPLTSRVIRRLTEITRNLGLGEEDAKRIENQLGLHRSDIEKQSKIEKTPSASTIDTDVEQSLTLDSRYQTLEKHLKAQKWKAADHETYRLMITQVGKNESDLFSSDDLENYPCEDLRIIDQLWIKYSQGRFGFSVQKQIWEEYGSPTEYNKSWLDFYDAVGWGEGETFELKYGQFLSSPKGLFPTIKGMQIQEREKRELKEIRDLSEEVESLFSRVKTCKF